MWRATQNRLAGEIRAIVPDLPGHGTSASVHYVSHADTVARLAELLRDRAPGGATVVGFSLGGQLAIQLAAEFPELVTGVLVVSAETKPVPARGATLALLKRTAPLAKQEWFAKIQAKQLGIPGADLPRYIRDSQALSLETLLASVGENISFTVPEGWRRFTGPATVVVGADERGLMHASARLTHEALAHSSLVIADNAAHDAPFTRPQLLADEIRALMSAAHGEPARERGDV